MIMGDEKDRKLCLRLCEGIKKMKPYLAMVFLQFGYAGMFIVSMVSLKRGMNHYILATYRHVVAFLFMAPFALLLERKVRPKLTLPIFLRILALAFLEPVLDQNLYYVGLKYTSATLASASTNVMPAITFILAIIFRLEVVNLKKVASVAKVIGTVITVSGAMAMTMYKGPILEFLSTHPGHGGSHLVGRSGSEQATNEHWVYGTSMVLAGCCSWAGFFILQSFTLKVYPAELSLTALICLMGAVEGAIISLIMERDMSAWKIGFDANLLAASYSGVVCSGIAFYVQSIVIKERGPVFATSFSPLCMIITAVLGCIILAEQIHLGSVIGAVVIVLGLYTVAWGKSKDSSNAKSTSALTNKGSNFDDDDDNGHELPIVMNGTTKSAKESGLVPSMPPPEDAILKIPA